MIVECPACSRRYDMSGRPAGSEARCRCGERFSLPEPPQTADALACPNCGANVPPTSTECRYCDAVLAIRPRTISFCIMGIGKIR